MIKVLVLPFFDDGQKGGQSSTANKLLMGKCSPLAITCLTQGESCSSLATEQTESAPEKEVVCKRNTNKCSYTCLYCWPCNGAFIFAIGIVQMVKTQ